MSRVLFVWTPSAGTAGRWAAPGRYLNAEPPWCRRCPHGLELAPRAKVASQRLEHSSRHQPSRSAAWWSHRESGAWTSGRGRSTGGDRLPTQTTTTTPRAYRRPTTRRAGPHTAQLKGTGRRAALTAAAPSPPADKPPSGSVAPPGSRRLDAASGNAGGIVVRRVQGRLIVAILAMVWGAAALIPQQGGSGGERTPFGCPRLR